MNEAQTEAIANADAHTNNVGLPTYTEILGMLKEAQRLGLTFDISRAYIDKQTELNARIKAATAV